MRSRTALSDGAPRHPGIHRALTSELKEFRLLVLLPSADFSSTIECRLVHATLDSGRQYEALSYVWGEPEFSQRILLDNEAFYITTNLETALRYSRRLDGDRTLWVDAICINQRDINERTEQVINMSKIYSQCSADLFWLGVPDEKSKRGMEILRNLEGRDISKFRTLGWTQYQHTWPRNQQSSWTISDSDWEALSQILQKPTIWHRVWVVQEISVAPNVLLMSGDEVLDWAVVEAVMGDNHDYTDAFHAPFAHGSRSMITALFSNARIFQTQRRFVRDMRQGGTSNLLDVLARFRLSKSTDPRDKVFALLGLVSDPLGVEVDYHKSKRDVFQRVVECLINSSGNLDILCQSQWANFNHGRDPELPSWVPDFSAPGQAAFLFAQRSIFSAGEPECSIPCQLSDSGHLRLLGVSLGRIAELHGLEYQDVEGLSSFNAWQLAKSWIPEDARPETSDWNMTPTFKYFTGEPLLQAFWRTVTVDCTAFPMARFTPDDIQHDMTILYRPDLLDGDGQDIKDQVSKLKGRRILNYMTKTWRFATSDSELYVMVPIQARQGDILAIFPGAKVPFVLRPVESSGEGSNSVFSLVGGAYIHGYMDGEAKAAVERGELKEEIFSLV